MEEVKAEEVKAKEVKAEEVKAEEVKTPDGAEAEESETEEESEAGDFPSPEGTRFFVTSETPHYFVQAPDGAHAPVALESETGLYVSGEMPEASARLLASVPGYELREEAPLCGIAADGRKTAGKIKRLASGKE